MSSHISLCGAAQTQNDIMISCKSTSGVTYCIISFFFCVDKLSHHAHFPQTFFFFSTLHLKSVLSKVYAQYAKKTISWGGHSEDCTRNIVSFICDNF